MNSTRCAACRYLRRRCPSDCIFSPYFPPDDPKRFICVHKIYGASNVGKMLQELPVNRRAEAAESLFFEAKCRLQDPVYGCVGIVTMLHQQIHDVQCQLARIQAQIAVLSFEQNRYRHQVEVTPPLDPISSSEQDDNANKNWPFDFNSL